MTTETLEKENHAISNARGWLEEMARMVRQLGEAEESGDPTKLDAATDEIQQSPLSVMVRDDWYIPGDHRRLENGPTEYEILLSTGGPALRIIGDLDHGQPGEFPRLQWQDWGTPWTDHPIGDERDNVLIYVNHFYFGD